MSGQSFIGSAPSQNNKAPTLQQGALARAVARHDGGLLALFEAEGDVREQLARPVAFGEAFDGEAVHAARKGARK